MDSDEPPAHVNVMSPAAATAEIDLSWLLLVLANERRRIGRVGRMETLQPLRHPGSSSSRQSVAIRQMQAMAALRYNALVTVGAFVIENERCYLHGALPVDELTATALDRTIAFIARESLKLRRQFSSVAEAPEFLGMFGD